MKPSVEWERSPIRSYSRQRLVAEPSLEERARSKGRQQGQSVTGTKAHLAASDRGMAEMNESGWRVAEYHEP